MNRIKVGDKVIHLDFDTEQIFLQDTEDEEYPYLVLLGRDTEGKKYELMYATTQSYRAMAKRMLGDRQITSRLTRLTLDLYEQLTHETYCNWKKPCSCRAI